MEVSKEELIKLLEQAVRDEEYWSDETKDAVLKEINKIANK